MYQNTVFANKSYTAKDNLTSNAAI